MERLSGHLAVFSFVLFSVLLPASVLRGQQDVVVCQNPFSSVFVHTGENSGRFWFASGRENGFYRFLYHGDKTPQGISSNIVFRIQNDKGTFFYCNTPEDFSLGGVRPQSSNGEVPFVPYDRLYTSAQKDTIELHWDNLLGVHVVMRFVAEQPANRYDDGADILVEFESHVLPQAPSGTKAGVLMMLDQDNGSAPEHSDRTSILTSRSYHPSYGPGHMYRNDLDTMPEYYLSGLFNSRLGSSSLMPVHRLRRFSLGGASLTSPDLLGVGSWKSFRSLSWELPSNLTTQIINDAAVIVRWDEIPDGGIVRTAFGTSSKSGNNLAYCLNDEMVATFRSVRLITLRDSGTVYDPAEFEVEMWVTNQLDSNVIMPGFELNTSFEFVPNNNSRLSLDTATPSFQSLELQPKETGKLSWRLSVDRIDEDSLVNLNIAFVGDSSGNLGATFEPCTLPVSFSVMQVVDSGTSDTTGTDTTRSDTTRSDTTRSDTTRTDTATTSVRHRIAGESVRGDVRILAVRPQPALVGRGSELVIRLQPGKGLSVLSLANTAGDILMRRELGSREEELSRIRDVRYRLPADIQPGVYYLHLESSAGKDSRKILVLE